MPVRSHGALGPETASARGYGRASGRDWVSTTPGLEAGQSGRWRSMTATQAGRAYEDLRRAIVRCELLPGERVSEQVLEERFGHGRAATRAALARLDQEGLVTMVPRQGTIISPVTLRDVRELFDTRRLVEPAAMAAAVGAPGIATLEPLERTCRAARFSPGDRAGAEAFLAANTRFHVAVVALTGNLRLARLVHGLLVELERMFQLGFLLRDRHDEMYHEHHELLAALRASDATWVHQVATSQIDAAETMVTEALLASPDLLGANLGPSRHREDVAATADGSEPGRRTATDSGSEPASLRHQDSRPTDRDGAHPDPAHPDTAHHGTTDVEEVA